MPDYKAIDALTGGDVGKEIFKILESKDTVPLPGRERLPRTLQLQEEYPQARGPERLKIRVVGSRCS